MPKTKKILALTNLIINLQMGKIEPPTNDTLPNEHLFNVTIYDLGIGIFLPTYALINFPLISPKKIDDKFNIRAPTIS